jgi:hypothetical protein
MDSYREQSTPRRYHCQADILGMYVIWRLKRKVTTRRKKQGMTPIEDPNDIPDPKEAADYVSVSWQSRSTCARLTIQVLTEKEQEQLHDQQEKFAKSQVSLLSLS